MANVKWKSSTSYQFPIRNGVRQGAISSPILFCFYMDKLFDLLRRSGSGCRIGSFYAGVHGYADDLLFLCPSRSGLQEMLDTASKYVAEHKTSFSTNPNPIIARQRGLYSLKLNGVPLPWVENSKYLGNKLTSEMNGFSSVIREKKARFIERKL